MMYSLSYNSTSPCYCVKGTQLLFEAVALVCVYDATDGCYRLHTRSKLKPQITPTV